VRPSPPQLGGIAAPHAVVAAASLRSSLPHSLVVDQDALAHAGLDLDELRGDGGADSDTASVATRDSSAVPGGVGSVLARAGMGPASAMAAAAAMWTRSALDALHRDAAMASSSAALAAVASALEASAYSVTAHTAGSLPSTVRSSLRYGGRIASARGAITPMLGALSGGCGAGSGARLHSASVGSAGSAESDNQFVLGQTALGGGGYSSGGGGDSASGSAFSSHPALAATMLPPDAATRLHPQFLTPGHTGDGESRLLSSSGILCEVVREAEDEEDEEEAGAARRSIGLGLPSRRRTLSDPAPATGVPLPDGGDAALALPPLEVDAPLASAHHGDSTNSLARSMRSTPSIGGGEEGSGATGSTRTAPGAPVLAGTPAAATATATSPRGGGPRGNGAPGTPSQAPLTALDAMRHLRSSYKPGSPASPGGGGGGGGCTSPPSSSPGGSTGSGGGGGSGGGSGTMRTWSSLFPQMGRTGSLGNFSVTNAATAGSTPTSSPLAAAAPPDSAPLPAPAPAPESAPAPAPEPAPASVPTPVLAPAPAPVTLTPPAPAPAPAPVTPAPTPATEAATPAAVIVPPPVAAMPPPAASPGAPAGSGSSPPGDAVAPPARVWRSTRLEALKAAAAAANRTDGGGAPSTLDVTGGAQGGSMILGGTPHAGHLPPAMDLDGNSGAAGAGAAAGAARPPLTRSYASAAAAPNAPLPPAGLLAPPGSAKLSGLAPAAGVSPLMSGLVSRGGIVLMPYRDSPPLASGPVLSVGGGGGGGMSPPDTYTVRGDSVPLPSPAEVPTRTLSTLSSGSGGGGFPPAAAAGCDAGGTPFARASPVTAAAPAAAAATAASTFPWEADEVGDAPEPRVLRAAKRVELVPIDHGLCLPHASHLGDVSCNWIFWKQASEPLSEVHRAYVAALDGRADAKLLYAALGERIRPGSLLTLRLCTALLQAGVRANLTVAEIGLMMVRDSGVGTLPVARPAAAAPAAAAARAGGAGDESDGGGDEHAQSALEQAYRRAKAAVNRTKRRARRDAGGGGGEGGGAGSSPQLAAQSLLPQQRKLPWNVPGKGKSRKPRKKHHAAHAAAGGRRHGHDGDGEGEPASSTVSPHHGAIGGVDISIDGDGGHPPRDPSEPPWLAFHDAILAAFTRILDSHIRAVLDKRVRKQAQR